MLCTCFVNNCTENNINKSKRIYSIKMLTEIDLLPNGFKVWAGETNWFPFLYMDIIALVQGKCY